MTIDADTPWPDPNFKTTTDALTAWEQIRAKMLQISGFVLELQSATGYETAITHGLMSAGVSADAARAVAREQMRLLQLLDDAVLNAASAAKLAGAKLQNDYVEPVQEWQMNGPRGRTHRFGLKVNG